MASAPSFSALPASWNSEKAASIDWENPADILFNGFTFLEMVAAHPALAAYYGMGAAAHGSTIPAERLEERQRAKHLFLHRVDPADIEKEGDNSGAAAAKVEASLTAAGGSRGRRGASSHGSAGTHLLKEVVLEKVRAAQEVRRAQCALLTRWAGEGLFQLRPERWCRYCGAPGHTARSCTQRHAAASGVRPAGSAEATALSIPAAVFENALLATSAEGCEEAQSEEASGGSAAASPGQKRGRDGTTRREEGGESAAAGMTVLQKFYAHQQRLEKHRLLDEKKKGNGGTQRSGRPGARGGERGAPRPELELFSDERRRGVVDRLDVSFNVGFVRVTGMAMDLKFFVDRSDCGVKRLQVGDKVTFKIDSSRDYPIAVDVRVEAPVITAGDVKAFMNQCRLAGQQTNSMELLSMIVSHTSEWQDVVRHVYALMLTHQQQQPQSQQEASSSNAAAPSWEPLPTWVSYVQHIIDLTTLHVNREPIHTSILVTFLKLLSSPVSQQIPPTATATATAAATTASSAEQSSTSISSSRGGPATTTSSSTAPIRFLPDLFSRAMTYWRDNVLPTVGLQQQQQRASTTRKTALDVSHSGGGGAPDVEERIAIMVDALCEATDLVVMARQYLAEFRSGKNFQPLYSILHNLLEEAVRAVASVPHLSGWSNVPNCTRRLRAAVVRLEKVDPSRSSFSSSSVAVIPTELELAVPPPYPTSLFNPSRLPVQRMANDPQYLLESKRRGAAAEEANDAGADTVFSPYASADSFITAHCQLLRADTFEATARLLAATCFQLPDYPPDAETKSDVEHAALYDQVRFMGRVLPRDRDYVYAQSYLFQVHPKSSQASLSKKLYQGACVCFVTALDPEHIGSAVSASGDAEPRAPPEIFWGTISSCDEKLLKAGIIVVSPCSTNPGGASVVPSFAELLSNLSRNAQQGRLDRCLMLETPIFYSGYAGIIQSLFTFLGPLAMPLPFGRRMIGPTDEENAAAIAAQKSNTTCKAHEGQDSAFPLGLGYIPPHCEQAFREIVDSIRNSCKLDAGQEEVMRVLPTRDIVLVQGPPGTGKSFIGCRVVEAYVRYKQRAASGDILQHISVGALSGGFPGKAKFPSPASGQQRTAHGVSLLPVLTPMVVITYKNHALDEFLVDLLHCKLWDSKGGAGSGTDVFPGGQRLVRIGGSSKEARLDAFNLSSLVREKADKSVSMRYREHIGVLHQRLDRLIKEIRHLENGRVPKAYFEKWLTAEQRTHMTFEDREEWLQGGRHISEGTTLGTTPTLPERNFYKTLLRTALEKELDKVQMEEAEAALRQVQQAAHQAEIAQRKKMLRTEAAAAAALVQEGAEDDEALAAGEVLDEEGEGEGVVRSIFQEMKRENESREYNNTLHITALTPEAIFLAHHPPAPPAGVPLSPPLQSLWSLEPETRHRYYAYLIQKTISEKAMNCFHIMARISNFLTIRQHAIETEKLALLRAADVVGLTTTGCALNQSLLRSLRPRVLVVEEAAEVLESQLLACMTDSLEQIILIGDHFQLKPKVETFSYEKHNHMNLSLFERLSGHIPVIRLTEQRRMHPEISALVRPFYTEHDLLDHPLLLTRPLLTTTGHLRVDGVPGLAKRVFFWRHQYPEEEAPGGSRSKINRQELEMVHQAVSHMVQQGVLQRSITVITPYLGQCRMLRSHLRLSHLPDVQVSTVDLFQGDENDVVVLSLVRTARLTEFLRTRNRLVVSCSRARFAMLMIGNDSLLHECEHWKHLLDHLAANGCVGNRLPVTVAMTAVAGASGNLPPSFDRVMYLCARKPK